MKTYTRTVATLMAVVLAAGLSGGCTKSQRRSRAIRTADRYFAAEQYDQAEASYQLAAKLVSPPSKEAVRQLGLLYSLEGRSLTALPYLRYAATNEPGNAAVHLALAQAWGILSQPAKARESALYALKLQPGNEEALLLLCDMATNASTGAQLKQSVQTMQKQDQDRSGYHLVLGVLLGKSKDLAGAEAEFKKAQAMNPKSPFVLFYLANLYAARNDHQATDETYKKMLEVTPMRSQLRIQYAKFLTSTGRPKEAREQLMEMAQKAPDYLPGLLSLMELSYSERQFDQCNQDIGKVLARDPFNYEALRERGRVAMSQGLGDEAVKDFEQMNQILAKDPQGTLEYELALAYLLDGNRPKALTALNRAINLNPNYTPARLLLADVNIRGGDADAAMAVLKPMEAALVSREKQATREEKTVELQVKLLLARAYLAQKAPSQAVAEFESLEKLYPEDPQIPYLKAKACLAGNDLVQARAAFEKTIALGTNFAPALEDLVDLDLRQRRAADAEALVRKEIVNYTNAAVPTILLGDIALAQTNSAEAEKLFQQAIQLNPKLPAAYLSLARLYVRENRTKQALDNLNALVALTNDVSALSEIGAIHDQLKEYDLARDSFVKVLAVNSNDAPALNNLAYLDAERLNRMDEAYQLAARGWELSANNPAQAPYAADTFGWILYRRGDYARALTLLQEAADRQVADAEVHYHLGMAHYMMGEEIPARLALQDAVTRGDFDAKADASNSLALLNIDPSQAAPAQRAELEKALAARPSDPIALMKLAAIEARVGDADKAAGHYETAITNNARNVQAMIALARLYAGPLRQAPKALALARNAHRISEDDPNIAALLGRLEFQARNFSDALGLLENASRNLAGQPDVLHDLAWCYFSMGKMPEAQTAMQNAVNTGVAFAKLDDARKFLDMMSAYSSLDQPATPGRVQQALQTDTNYVPALVVSALLAERQGKTADAEQLYERVLAEYPALALGRRQIGLLYTRDGNTAKAFENLEKARVDYPEDSELIRASGIVACERKEYQRSVQWLTQCLPSYPADPYVDYYLGMDYSQLHQAANARKYLQMAANAKLPDTMAADAKRVLTELK